MKSVYLLSLIMILYLASVPAEAYPHYWYVRPHITRFGKFVPGHYRTQLYTYRRHKHFW